MINHVELNFGTAHTAIPATTPFAIATIIAMSLSETTTIPNESSVHPIARAGQSSINANENVQKIIELIEHTLAITRQFAATVII